jgi:hypothetical protein
MLSFVDQTTPQTDLPLNALDLKRWLVEVLATAPPGTMAKAVRDVETIAAQRFPAKLVVHLLRQVLSDDLVGHQ